MEATCSSEMSVDFQQSTQCYIPVGETLHNYHCDLFIYAVSNSGYIVLNDRLSSEQWTEKDMEGTSHGLNWCTILVVAWSDCGKLQKTLTRKASFQVEILTWDLNMEEECHPANLYQ
jgi:hypothetical protein